jgi:hypothetical protein
MSASREILTREVAEKLRLEAILKPGIRKIFARVVDDFRTSVARTGQPPEIARYRIAFETLLDEHYRRMQKSFSGAILLHNKVDTFAQLRNKAAKPTEEDQHDKELIAAIFLLWREKHAPVQADFIAQTTAKDMADAIDQARQALTEEGKPIDKRSLALTAVAILKRILRVRVDVIAVTETQTAAETTKAVEASVVTKIPIPGIPVPPGAFPPVIPPFTPTTPSEPDIPLEPLGPQEPTALREQPSTLKKSWITLRDNRVRATHHAAHGQTRLINEAFAVGSSSMMYPGDTSMGAPIREIIHCRCSAQYLF